MVVDGALYSPRKGTLFLFLFMSLRRFSCSFYFYLEPRRRRRAFFSPFDSYRIVPLWIFIERLVFEVQFVYPGRQKFLVRIQSNVCRVVFIILPWDCSNKGTLGGAYVSFHVESVSYIVYDARTLIFFDMIRYPNRPAPAGFGKKCAVVSQ